MRMRPIHSAAVAFGAALAVTVGSPGPAQASPPPPDSDPDVQQSQPPVESRSSGRSPSDNNLRKRSDRGKYESAQPVKPSTGTRAKRDEEIKLRLLGQERQVAGEIRGHLAGHAHPQRPAGAACEQEQRPRQRRGAPRKPRRRKEHAAVMQTAQPNETSANSGSQAPSPARAGSTLGDTYDEALGEVFKVRIDDLLK